jgi:uncharacterized protein (TIRG00374 family)
MIPYPKMKSRSAKRVLIAAKIIISVLVLMFLIHIISYKEIVKALAQASKTWALAGLSLLALNLFLQYKKWLILAQLEKPDVAPKEVFTSLLAGITLGFITPGRLGEFGRSMFISQTNWTHLFSFILADKLLILLNVILFGIIGLTYFIKSFLTLHYWVLVSILAFIIEIILVYALIKPSLFKNTVLPFTKRHSFLFKISEGFKKLNSTIIKQLIMLNLAYYLTFTIQFCFFIKSFFPLSFFKCFIASCAILIVKTMFPIAVGDLGVREGATVLFLSHFNVPKAAAFNASLMLFIINILIPSLLGFLYILKKQWTGFSTKQK